MTMSKLIINMWEGSKEEQNSMVEAEELRLSNYLSVLQKRLWLTDKWMAARERFIKARMNNNWLIKEGDLFRLYAESEELNRTKDFEILNKIYDEKSWEYIFTNDEQRRVFDDCEIRTWKKCFGDEEKFRKTYMVDERDRTFELLKTYSEKNHIGLLGSVGEFMNKLDNYFQDSPRKEDFSIHGAQLKAMSPKIDEMGYGNYLIKVLISIINWDYFAWESWYLFPQDDWWLLNRHRGESSFFAVIQDKKDNQQKDWTLKFKYIMVPKERWIFIDKLEKIFPHTIFAHRDNIIEKMEANEPELKPKEALKEINIGDIFIDNKNVYEIIRKDGDTIWYKNINTWLSISSVKTQNIPKNRKKLLGQRFKTWNWEQLEIKTINGKVGYKILWKNTFLWKNKKEFIENIMNETYEIIL